jgi:hypothetical protein
MSRALLAAGLALALWPVAAEGQTSSRRGQAPAIGARAPEIEGEDVFGRAFRLSDYRGKVVVLDFWGNW